MIDAAHYEQEGIWGEDNVFLPEHQRLRFEAIGALVPEGTASLLDVGSGDGRVLHHLAGTADPPATLLAAERSFAALRLVELPGVQASGDALPLRDRGVETVICCEVLEHLPPPIYAATRRELARVAAETIVITVPNRENRRRADLRCAECGCRYNPERHLRSFHPTDLPGLFDGFELVEMLEAGPRQPFYPRLARLALERVGVLSRPGAPSCPQCGTIYDPRRTAGSNGQGSASLAVGADTVSTGHRSRRYQLVRAASPKVRHRYWLGARYQRMT
jgi:hypothetical protein